METLAIFDEFNMPVGNITNEQRHQKRTALEPLVFNILRKKYGARLEAEYMKQPPPNFNSNNKCLLIIERRIHPNLEFVLHNCATFAKDWSICFICSHINLEYCKQITGPWKRNIRFLPMFQDSPNYMDARSDYNALLKSESFWEDLPWEMVGIVQTDSYFLRPLPTAELLKYDFLAAPAMWDTDNMVGGMSFRRPAAMKRICCEFPEEFEGQGEDIYFSHGVNTLDLKRPRFPDSVQYISESYIYEEPIGTHQWWTYLYTEHPDHREFFHLLLHLEIPS